MNQTFNSITSEELCKKLSIKDTRSLLTTEGFPKPLFNEGEMLFSKEEVSKYFNIENIDEAFITTKEAAKYVNLGTEHLKNLASQNKVPSYRMKSVKGSGYLFRKSELDIFLKTDVKGNTEFVNYFVGNEIMKNIFLNYIELYRNVVTIREHEVVYEYFFNRKTFVEIGKHFDLTPIRVRSIFYKAMNRFNRKLTTQNMLDIGELERKIIQKDIEIKYLRELIYEKKLASSDAKQTEFNEYQKTKTCVDFLSRNILDEDISVRALNILRGIDKINIYDILVNFNTFNKTARHLIKLRNMGKRTCNELTEFIIDKEKEFEIVTGVSSEEFFSDRPKTPENLSLFSKIHANFKN
jgi:excisionase family DNA binding protein